MFLIRLLPTSERGPEGEELGEITIGDFTERFACTFSPESITSIWRSKLQSLLKGEPFTALIHDPRFAWVICREGNCCFVQQRFSVDGRFNDLLPRQTETDEGERISEWPTSLEAIQAFLELELPENP